MKICVISFDFWNYDAHIVEELRRKGIDANHINIGAYQHKNFPARVQNTISVSYTHLDVYKSQIIIRFLWFWYKVKVFMFGMWKARDISIFFPLILR